MANTRRNQAGRQKPTTAKNSTNATAQAQNPPEVDELDAIERLEAEAQQLEALAAAAAKAAEDAKAAYIARQTGSASTGASSQSAESTEPVGGNVNPENDGNYLDMLSRLFDQMSSSDWDPARFDSMTQGVGMVLGSGPAFATLGSMLANSTAQGSVLVNATQMQRQLDQVGLCTTSACVKQLLSISQPDHEAG